MERVPELATLFIILERKHDLNLHDTLLLSYVMRKPLRKRSNRMRKYRLLDSVITAPFIVNQ